MPCIQQPELVWYDSEGYYVNIYVTGDVYVKRNGYTVSYWVFANLDEAKQWASENGFKDES